MSDTFDYSPFSQTRTSVRQRLTQGPITTEALGDILAKYIPKLRAQLVLRRHIHSNDAADYVQDYVVKKICEKDILSKWDPNKGKLRTFLLVTLFRFVKDKTDKQRRHWPKGPHVRLEEQFVPQDRLQDPEMQSYQTAWAHHVIEKAWTTLQQDSSDLYSKAFKLRYLDPILHNHDAPSDAVLSKMFNKTGGQIAGILRRLRARFAVAIDQALSEFLSCESEEALDQALTGERAELFRIASDADAAKYLITAMSLDGEDAISAQQLDCEIAENQRDSLTDMLSTASVECSEIDEVLALPFRHHLFEGEADLAAMGAIESPAINTIRETFEHKMPSKDFLRSLKEVAKTYTRKSDSDTLPKEVAIVIYAGTMAAGIVHHNDPLTTLTNGEILRTLRDALQHEWIPATVRVLIHNAISKLETVGLS